MSQQQYVVGELYIQNVSYPANLVIVPDSWVLSAINESTQKNCFIVKYIAFPLDEEKKKLVEDIIKSNGNPPSDWCSYIFNITGKFESFQIAKELVEEQVAKHDCKKSKSKTTKGNGRKVTTSKRTTIQALSNLQNSSHSPNIHQDSVVVVATSQNDSSSYLSSQKEPTTVFQPLEQDYDTIINQSDTSNLGNDENNSATYPDITDKNINTSSESIINLKSFITDSFKGMENSFDEHFKKLSGEVTTLAKRVSNLEKDVKHLETIVKEESKNVTCMMATVFKEKLDDYLSCNDFIKKHNINIPFLSVESFDSFQKNLDTNDAMLADFIKFLESNVTKKEGLHKTSKLIIKSFIDPFVLSKYTAQKADNKRKINEEPKKIFKTTLFSKLLQAAVRKVFGPTDGTENLYLSELSSIFNLAKGWKSLVTEE